MFDRPGDDLGCGNFDSQLTLKPRFLRSSISRMRSAFLTLALVILTALAGQISAIGSEYGLANHKTTLQAPLPHPQPITTQQEFQCLQVAYDLAHAPTFQRSYGLDARPAVTYAQARSIAACLSFSPLRSLQVNAVRWQI